MLQWSNLCVLKIENFINSIRIKVTKNAMLNTLAIYSMKYNISK